MPFAPFTKRAPRRPTACSYIVISGESVTLPQAAARLNITVDQLHTRRKRATSKLAQGEALTWEMLGPHVRNLRE